MTSLDAIILAGGKATRLGGADKPGLVVGERTLLETAIAAARDAGAAQVIVVGPSRGSGDIAVREDPPGSGPVPALRAAAGRAAAPWVALLAADLPLLRGDHLTALLGAARENGTGAVLRDDTGRPQWLVSCWNAGTLRNALAAYLGDSLRGLLAPLNPACLLLPGTPWLDCDTPADLARARAKGHR
jgi:molybdopterin-guanine dinucleotide biosynthesis protein A